MSGSLLCDNLASYSLQVGLLIALAACLPWLVRLRAPRARLLFWQLLLAACLLLPVMRPWRPRAMAGAVEVSTAVARVARTTPRHRPIPWGAVALAVVAAGALGRLAWLGVGFRRLRRYRLHAVPFAQSEICPTLLSGEISSPVTFGLRRPVILLPAAFPALSLPMQQAILCHERAHVVRRDWLFTVAEEVVRALLWFHPAIWWLLSEIQLAREQAVDQRVVAATGARDPYVDALLAIAGAGMELDLAPAPLFLRRRHLKQRVLGILKEKNMSKRALISAFAASLLLMAAACWFVTGAVPLAAAPQAVADAAGVSINLNGAPLVHRTPVDYPASAIAGGVEGTVAVEVTLDAQSGVSGANVLSGPEELRKPVMQSVVSWHFGKEVAGSTRVVNIDFALPAKREPTVSAGFGPTPPAVMGKALKGIDAEGLSGQAQEELLARLPVHTGDVIDAARMGEIRAAAQAFDPHLAMALAPAGDDGVTLRIAPVVAQPAATPGQPPSKIRVGGNVQAMNLIQQQRPVYPVEAKAAHIQGKVAIEATIGPDGHIEDLQVLSGDPILAHAAVEAARNWVYQPTLLNGDPVTVVTNIDVNFTLSQ